MDGFWPCLDLRRAQLGESWPAWPPTIFSTSFDIDFLMHLGMDLASIFDTFWTFGYHFRFNPSTIEKVWIFIEFPLKIEALEPWKIQVLRGTL